MGRPPPQTLEEIVPCSPSKSPPMIISSANHLKLTEVKFVVIHVKSSTSGRDPDNKCWRIRLWFALNLDVFSYSL